MTAVVVIEECEGMLYMLRKGKIHAVRKYLLMV